MISETIVPNDNITVPYGPLMLTKMVFDMLEMDRPLSKLKRKQGVTPSEVIIALVSHAMQMRGPPSTDWRMSSATGRCA